MSDPLSSFASLIPTPVSSNSRAASPANPKRQDAATEDPFASLFAPITPGTTSVASSSSQTPIFSDAAPATEPARPRPRHGRGASEADWGAFVTVPTSQDPLAESGDDFASPVAAPAGPYVSDPSFEFFESFGESARQAASAKRKSVLDELLAHEDDPLYFLSGASTSAAPATNGQASNAGAPLSHTTVSTKPPTYAGPAASLLDFDEPHSRVTSSPPPIQPPMDPTHANILHHTEPITSPIAPAPPYIDRRPTDSFFGAPAFTPSETHATDLLAEAISSSHDPPFPSPEIVNSQPRHARTLSFASRWLRPGRISPSQSTVGNSSSAVSGAAPVSASPSGSSSLAATLTRTMTAALSGGPPPPARENPFAAHIFQPASGAPGYAGERPLGPPSTKVSKFEFKSDDVEEKRAVVLEGRKASTTPVLTSSLASKIRASFPVLHRLSKSWELLYSLDQHGISLKTLYTRCSEPLRRAGTRPALFIIRSANGEAFGAFVPEGIHASPGTYYGGGESFLWRTDKNEQYVDVFRWTGKNDYVALCDNDSISFGGGEGHYGLFLDDILQDGSSARCPTFENEPLCEVTTHTKSVPFECVGVEVWGVGI